MNNPARSSPARSRRRWIRLSLSASSLAAALVLICAGCGLMCRPSWYQPPSVDLSRLDADRDEVVRIGDRIGDALNARRPIDIVIDEAQLNRLLAAGGDAWPEPYRWELHDAGDPLVDFRDGGVRIGVTVTAAGTPVVLSCRVAIEVAGDGLGIRIGSTRLGALPLPSRMLLRPLVAALRDSGVRAPDDAAAALRVPNAFVWPNGRQPYRIASIEFSDTAIRIRLEPR